MQQRIDKTKLLTDRISLLHQLPKGCVTCEAGVAFGEFSRRIIDIVQPSAHYLIDSWTHAGRYDDAAFLVVLKEFKKELRSGQARLLRTDSVSGLLELPDVGIDFLYIDTDHSYQTTKKELVAAQAKVSLNGLIAGHDYTHGLFNPERQVYIKYGVVEAVNEFMRECDFDLRYLTVDSGGAYSFALQRRSQGA